MHQNFISKLFEHHRHIQSVQNFVFIVICLVVLLLWVIEFGRTFELYKIHWINLQDRSKIYISMFCQAFWVVKLLFYSNVLYDYSYFCSKNHSKSVCFSHQNTEVNFWVLLQRSVLLIVYCQCCYNYWWFSTKICISKIPEKLWLNIKHFII